MTAGRDARTMVHKLAGNSPYAFPQGVAVYCVCGWGGIELTEAAARAAFTRHSENPHLLGRLSDTPPTAKELAAGRDARDELTTLLADRLKLAVRLNACKPEAVADAILAAGWRPPGALTPTGEAALAAAARREALEECAALRCSDCRDGAPSRNRGDKWVHEFRDEQWNCEASDIRALIDQPAPPARSGWS